MTPEEIQKLIQRAMDENRSAVSKMESLNELAIKEERSFNEDEEREYKDLQTRSDKCIADIDRNNDILKRSTGVNMLGGINEGASTASNDAGNSQREHFTKFLRGEISDKELRSLQVSIEGKGGNIVAPEEFVNEILKKVDDILKIRSRATITRLTGAQSLGVPTLATDLDDYEWTPEVGKVSEDTKMSFNKRVFKPNQLSKLVKVSDFLAKNRPDISSLIVERLAYKLGATLEKQYMLGDGVSKPLGLFTPSNDGISTARDIDIGTSAKPITYEGLVDALYGALKEGYRNRAVWVLNSRVIAELRKLTDGNKQPIWQPALTQGNPNLLLGIPVIESAFAPADLTTGEYIGILGDLSKYWIVDSMDFEVKVLGELYSETNEIGYLGKYWGDGQPVMEEAFVRLKVGA